jgi:DNA-binding transcriptional regulator LsrR (DeoR family)
MILVAGTRLKAAAIRSLLDGGQYNIRFLCTDEPTAKAILGE